MFPSDSPVTVKLCCVKFVLFTWVIFAHVVLVILYLQMDISFVVSLIVVEVVPADRLAPFEGVVDRIVGAV